MKKLIGIVRTEPEDAGRIVFTLLVDNKKVIPCMSGAGYKSVKPKRGERVAVIGDTVHDFTWSESFHFVYSLLEILPPVAEPTTA